MVRSKKDVDLWAREIGCEEAKALLREKLEQTKEKLQEADQLFVQLLDTDRYANFMLYDVAFDRCDVKQIEDKLDVMIWQMPSMAAVLQLLNKMFSFGNKVVELTPRLLSLKERLCLDYAFTRHDFIDQTVEYEEHHCAHTNVTTTEEAKVTITLTDKGLDALRKFNCSL